MKSGFYSLCYHYVRKNCDDPLPKLEIQAGLLIGNQYGKLYYTNGEEEIFYFSFKENITYPDHLEIYNFNRTVI